MHILKTTFLYLPLFATSIIFGMDGEQTDVNRAHETRIEIIKIGGEKITIVGIEGKKVKFSLPATGKTGAAIEARCQKKLKEKQTVEVHDNGLRLERNRRYTVGNFDGRRLAFVIRLEEHNAQASSCCCVNNCTIL